MEVQVVNIDVVVCVQLRMHLKLSFEVLLLLQDLVVQFFYFFLHFLLAFQRWKVFELLRVLPELVATVVSLGGLIRQMA